MKALGVLAAQSVAAAFAGVIAWGVGDFAGVALALPIIWASARSKRDAYLVALAYYLGGSWVIPDAAKVFFGHDWSLALGLTVWILAGLANALPWALFWRGKESRPIASDALQLGWRLASICIAISIPPLAIIGWLNPFLGAAWFFPGWGGWAIAAGLTLAIAGSVAVRHAKNTVVPHVAAAIAIAFASAALQRPLPSAPEGWVGVNTQLGYYPTSEKDLFEHRKAVALETLKQLDAGARVIIFPEQILGLWSDKKTGVFLETIIRLPLEKRNALIMAGVAGDVDGTGRYQNSLMLMDGKRAVRYDSRQSVPVAMWKPWSDETAVINWNTLNVHQIAGKRVLLSFCYEDFIPILAVSSFVFDSPQVIISVANGWWVKGTNEPAIQYRHIATIARIFNVPIVRALNR